MKKIYLTLLGGFLALGLTAQVANDDCAGAVALPDTITYCSGAAAFTTVGATTSLEQEDYAVCIDEKLEIKDVWFTFTALRNSAAISVAGDVPGNRRGSLEQPQFSLYTNSCDSLITLDACRSPSLNPQTNLFANSGSLVFNELVVGESYTIMVGGRQGFSGTFELCIEQFEAVPAPSGDCATGVILCDKSPFAVNLLQGFGNTREDLLSDDLQCNSDRTGPDEMNSAWYKWTCDQAGSLSFVIDPLGSAPNEDLDFVLFELEGGIDDCGPRRALRRMFSGETGGQEPALNLPCLGETGLADSDTDDTETCGCDRGDNNFVQSINMEAGKSYALVIMNFTGSGDGFAIEFGGTGTFRGPRPAFSSSTQRTCVGEALTFEDNSTSVDMIVAREWDFGPTATPQTASGPGPHSVFFSEAGSPAVSLVVTTSRDCEEIVSAQEVEVVCCDDQFSGSGTVSDVVCAGDANGRIDFSGTTTFPAGGVTYLWSNGETTASISDLERGTYSVTLGDASNCERVFDFMVGGPEPFVFDTLITLPSCTAGSQDGTLELTVLSGGAGGYRYSFNGGPFSTNNRLENVPESTVNVRVLDASDCPAELDIDVSPLQLALAPGDSAFVEPICSGDANGRVEIRIANGQAGYRYDFNRGDGFQTDFTLGGLPAGIYNVDVIDANDCTGNFTVSIPDPPPLTIAAEAMGSSCFGTDDGTLVALADGGRPDYNFRWSDGSSLPELRTGISPGNYTISVTDNNGCLRTASATVTEPEEIVAEIVDRTDLTCFGEPVGSFTLGATGGSPDYVYSSDGEIFQTEPLLDGLQAGNYRLYVMDANGCQDSLSGDLTQPEEFIVDAGPGGRIILGFDTVLTATSNYDPISYTWTPEDIACIVDDCTRVRARPVETTVYTVTGQNAAGCLDSAEVRIAVTLDLPLFVPNAISPNGDGVNDRLTVFGGRAIEEVEVLRVYDRWGGLIYQNDEPFSPNDPSQGWDGTREGQPVNPAVFVYYAEIRYINGDIVQHAGDVTVIR